MEVFSGFLTLAFSKYAIPVWGIISGVLGYLLKRHSSRRDDFVVIRDTLYEEIDRLKTEIKETRQSLEDSAEDNKKCEAKYYELALQHKELLKHCVFLSRELKALQDRIKGCEDREQYIVDDKRRINNEDSGTTTE
jgi:chromosome segregation ATPase